MEGREPELKEPTLSELFEQGIRRKLESGQELTPAEATFVQGQQAREAVTSSTEAAGADLAEIADLIGRGKVSGSRWSWIQKVMIATDYLVHGLTDNAISTKWDIDVRTLAKWRKDEFWQMLARLYAGASIEEGMQAARGLVGQGVTEHSQRRITQNLSLVERQMSIIQGTLEAGYIEELDPKMGLVRRAIKPIEHQQLAKTLEQLMKVGRQESGQEHREQLEQKGKLGPGEKPVEGASRCLDFDLNAAVEYAKADDPGLAIDCSNENVENAKE